MNTIKLTLTALVVSFFAFALPASASQTGEIQGYVVDDSGLPVVGVRVILSSPQMIGGEKLGETDRDGRFRFAKSFGGDADDFVVGMSRVPAGALASGFVLTGRIDGTANLDPDGSLLRVARGRGDVFVSVFDLSGDLLN